MGRLCFSGSRPSRFQLPAIVLSVLPDVDVMAFAFGIPYGSVWGHRGFTHSLFFAFLASLVASHLVFRESPRFSRKWWLVTAGLFSATASHGLLDAMTDGGLGVAFFAPFDEGRYFFPWRPLRVSPVGIGAFFSGWGARVIVSEMVWIWIPALALLFLLRQARGSLGRTRSSRLQPDD